MPHVSASMFIYVLNPNSSNKEGAIRYLEYITQSRYTAEQAVMLEGMEPMMSDAALEWLAEIDAQIADWTTQLEDATPSQQSKLQADIDSNIAYRREVEQAPGNWSIHAEALRQYRALVPYIDFQLHPLTERWVFYHGDKREEFLTILRQYAQGMLSLDQCIAQMDSRMERMFLEDAL